jgi:pimeloyl-ACP methyl ester carboxylesterase
MLEQVLNALVPDSGRAGQEMSISGVSVDPARVRCPLLVIAAESDRFIPMSTITRIARRYGAPLETARGSGHMLIVEPGWERLASRVADWIETSVESIAGESPR